MKLEIKLIIGLFLILSPAFAQAAQLEKEEAELGIEFDAAWASKYIWRGFDLYDDRAAFQPSIDFDLFETGFSVNVWGSTACSRGYGDSDELDYSVTYQNSLFAETKYQTDYSLTWLYYDYFRISSDEADSQEFDLSLSLPKILPYNITPTYTIAYLYAAQSGSPASSIEMEGFVHILGLTYDCNLPETDLPLTFSWDITYNDGQGGTNIDHDLSHMTWGIASSIDLGTGSFTPAVFYQTSMEDSVNDENEFWTALSYTLSF